VHGTVQGWLIVMVFWGMKGGSASNSPLGRVSFIRRVGNWEELRRR